MSNFDLEIYTNIEDVPVDDYDPSMDGDDSIVAEGGLSEVEEEIRTLASAVGLRNRRIAPFVRTIKGGTKGRDVVAVKRALSRAGHGKWLGLKFTPLFGPFAVKSLKAFQRKNDLRADGVYGKTTHERLARFFEPYEIKLLMAQRKVSGSQGGGSARQKIVTSAIFGYNVRASINYTQSWLRMYGVRNKIRPPRIPRWEDCSSFATWLYWLAGVRDPNGLGFNGQGWTGTLQSRGRRISLNQLQPADLIFYGPGGNSHVTIYIGFGKCISHGSNAGPLLLAYNYRPIHSARSYF